jgi:hypothetical protein
VNVLLFAALSLVQTHRIEQTMSITIPSLGGGQSQTSVLFWDGSKLRADTGKTNTSIVDFKSGDMVLLDHTKREYTELKIADMVAQMKIAQEQMRVQNPQAYDATMKAQAQPFTLTPTEDQKKILGFDAKKFVVKQGERTAGEAWFTKAIDLGDAAQYVKEYAALFNTGTGNVGELFVKSEHGYTMKSAVAMDLGGMKMQYVTEITKYDKVPSDAARFEVPAGYKKVDPNASHEPGKTPAPPGGAIPAGKK